MKLLFLATFIASGLLAEDKPAPAPTLTDKQIITYYKAQAELLSAQSVVTQKSTALTAAIEDMQKTCPLTIDQTTQIPKCVEPPKVDAKTPQKAVPVDKK